MGRDRSKQMAINYRALNIKSAIEWEAEEWSAISRRGETQSGATMHRRDALSDSRQQCAP